MFVIFVKNDKITQPTERQRASVCHGLTVAQSYAYSLMFFVDFLPYFALLVLFFFACRSKLLVCY
jgi:hypothetical protein